MLFQNILKMRYLFMFLLVEIIFISCSVPSTQRGIGIGDADFSDTSSNVGSNPDLPAPQNLKVLNNKTATETFLSLQWDPVPNADGYALYRAVYPTTMQSHLEDKAYRFFMVIKGSNNTGYQYPIPHVPLRRYSFRVTAINLKGESDFSAPVDGWRLPVDEKEALMDIDYTIHFAQSQVPGFGSAGKNVTLKGRGSGTYLYSTPVMGKIQSRFSSYADFETIINGDPKMQVTLNPMGMKMNGALNVSGLYNATLTYINLQGVEGGLTKSGSIKISYQSPEGLKEKTYDYRDAKVFMRSVAEYESEKSPAPPASEWDESKPEFTRAARSTALSLGD